MARPSPWRARASGAGLAGRRQATSPAAGSADAVGEVVEHAGEVVGTEEARHAGHLVALGVVEHDGGDGLRGDPTGDGGVVVDVDPGEPEAVGTGCMVAGGRLEGGHESTARTAPGGPQVHGHPASTDGLVEVVVTEVGDGGRAVVVDAHAFANPPGIPDVPGTVEAVRIEVFSDVVCPWCFLAARRLRRALDELTAASPADGGGTWAAEVEVRWRAFQLDPGARRGSTTLREVLERKYGPGSFEAMTSRFATLGPPEGIDYRFDLAVRAPTLDAHRLMAWAWDTGGAPDQGRLAEALFAAYFDHGADIADHATLVGLAGSAGLDATLAAEVLAGEAYAADVATDLAEAAELDIHAVPTMVVDGGVAIPGAQDVATMRQILTRLHARSR